MCPYSFLLHPFPHHCSPVPGSVIGVEVCPAGSKPSHCLILQKSLEPGNFSHSCFSRPSVFEAAAILVICEQVSFKVSSGGHVTLSSTALIPGKGCAGNSCAGFRDPVFTTTWLLSNGLALGTVAQAACSLSCPARSLGIPREATS